MILVPRAFWALIVLPLAIALGLGITTFRLAFHLSGDLQLTTIELTRWCLSLLARVLQMDELLSLGLALLLPVSLLLGMISISRQWWTTRQLLQEQTVTRLQRLPRRLFLISTELGLSGRLDMVQAEQPYSFCYGLFRPRVCISTGLVYVLTKAELEAVLLHERHHLRCRDPLKMLISRALARAFFFVPLVAELGKHYLIAMEVAADGEVIRRQGHGRWLASALYKLITTSSAVAPGVPLAGPYSAIDTRIDHLLIPEAQKREPLSAQAILLSAPAILVIITIVAAPDLLDAGAHLHAFTGSVGNSCHL